jgi:ABC-type Fe3+/spermidine/putrescine transport system ATPase subunit
MLRVNNLSITLGDFSLKDINLFVREGEYCILLGPSGAGKTVLLEALAGLVVPDGGEIILDGENITNRPIRERRMGLVYQQQALFPHMDVAANVRYGERMRKMGKGSDVEVERLADEFGFTHLLQRYPGTLSCGEAQRVALARTLATEPRCLLLDEPISSLDVKARSEIRELLRALHGRGHTVLHVTHDYEEAASLATRIGVMEKGTIIQSGTPKEVFENPKSDFVADFVNMQGYNRDLLKLQGNFVTGDLS